MFVSGPQFSLGLLAFRNIHSRTGNMQRAIDLHRVGGKEHRERLAIAIPQVDFPRLHFPGGSESVAICGQFLWMNPKCQLRRRLPNDLCPTEAQLLEKTIVDFDDDPVFRADDALHGRAAVKGLLKQSPVRVGHCSAQILGR